ncbi:CoxG family protein [Halosimplex salinum]|uniref:CoxG family protein n=1 Tax=Halosimplex salinum TaxID=1710538 RepID=UPI000F47AD43|nr:SRPBCC domain-containing protein [Halosimplex salinum]
MSHPDNTREPDEAVPDEQSDTADVAPDDEGAQRLEFSDAVYIDADPEELWACLSDPELLTECIPGAESVERVSDRTYALEITRGVSRLTVSLSGEAEFVELNPPDHVVTSATAFDSTTGSDFDVLAAMEIQAGDRTESRLVYRAEVTYSGGAATLNPSVLRPIVNRDIETYFQNVSVAVENRSR